MSKHVRQIENITQLPAAMGWAQAMANKGLDGGPVQIALSRPSLSQIQNAKFHAMIQDIHHQCFRGSSFDGVKAVLVNQFALEQDAAGEPLSHPGEKVWDWKTQEPVYVRPSTTKFTKKECAAFIEYLYASGTELGVQWSEKALAVYDEYREAA